MKIGILQTGHTLSELAATHGSFSSMFIKLLGSAPLASEPLKGSPVTQTETQEPEFDIFNVIDGEFPNSATDCDGWLITGSKHGVYEDLPWMQQLQNFIRDIADQKRPLIGICFGHQIVATALGGKVEKSDKGWGIGKHRYQLSKRGLAAFCANSTNPEAPLSVTSKNQESKDLVLNAFHQDQVTIKPDSAEVIASSEFCPFAALAYGSHILTFQPHPEFTTKFEADLVEARRGTLIPDPVCNAALESLNTELYAPDAQQVGRWMLQVLSQ